MDGDEYGFTGIRDDSFLGSFLGKEIAAPEGCEYLNSLQAVKNSL